MALDIAVAQEAVAAMPRQRRKAAPPHHALGLDDAVLLEMYRAMLVARLLSERCQKLAFGGAIDVAIPSEGHEAAQVASMRLLRPADFAYLYYRSVPAAYARGMTAREILLDHFGRAAGPSSGGKNIPGHWAKRTLNLMSVSGSVGTQIPNAVGTALASKLRGEDAVTAVYFGDGAASKGDFHEGLNFAAIHKLPVVLICENNGVAISVPFALQSPVPSVADRAPGYAVPGVSVDGADLLAVYAAMKDAVARARRGDGPTLIEARVDRHGQHTNQVGDLRTTGEIATARGRDPLPRAAAYLRGHGLLDDRRERELRDAASAEVADAVSHAETAPAPAAEDAYRPVYAGDRQAPAPLLAHRRAHPSATA